MSAAGPPQGTRPLGGAARSADRGGHTSAAGPPQGTRPLGGAARSVDRGEHTSVRIQPEDFDVGRELAALRANDARVGAVASFIGTVRDVNDAQEVTTLTLEHYAGMTEQAIEQIIAASKTRFDIYEALVIHRIGQLQPTDQIVLVAVTSAHRGDAFDACRFIMDYLKTQAPFWKKEATPQGSRWVDARTSDDEAVARWELLPK